MVFCFFFKQKMGYKLRMSDWSSGVCSSVLREQREALVTRLALLSVVLSLGALILSEWLVRRTHGERQMHGDCYRRHPPPLRPGHRRALLRRTGAHRGVRPVGRRQDEQPLYGRRAAPPRSRAYPLDRTGTRLTFRHQSAFSL